MAQNPVRAEWLKQSPFPIEYGLTAVAIPDSNVGYAVGELGTVVASKDGGASWTVQPTGTTAKFTALQFLDARMGWAVGYSGSLFKTEDGGSLWKNTAGTDFTGVMFNAVSFPSRDTGWVVGTSVDSLGRCIIRTTDGGKTWEAQGPKAGPDDIYRELNGVHFIDSHRGWVAGEKGFYSTIDAGNTWTPINPSIPSRFSWNVVSAIQFVTPLIGWMAISTPTGPVSWGLLQTRDGGLSWQEILANDSSRIISFRFLDANTGFATIGDSLLKTTNAGVKWSMVGKMPISGTIQFRDARYGWLANGQRIYATRDGGATWHSLNQGVIDDLIAISFVGDSMGWVAGRHLIGHTRDGMHWETQWENPGIWIKGLTFPNSRTGYVVGQTFSEDPIAVVLNTLDGGESWTSKSFPGMNFSSAYFLDAEIGWVSGFPGVLLMTRDRGANWSKKPGLGEREGFRQMQFQDSLLGMALGGNSIWKTSDGGTSWTEQAVIAPVDDGNLTSFQFIGPDTGFASYLTRSILCNHPGCPTVTTGYLASTSDGGAHWTARKLPVSAPIVRFANSRIGWIAGDAGAIYKTSDGGVTWVLHSYPSLANIQAIHAPMPEMAWFVGQNGLILNTMDGGQQSNPIKRLSNSRPRSLFQFARGEIIFDLASPKRVRVALYGLDGKTASVLSDRSMDEGRHLLNATGSRVKAGVYVLDFWAGNSHEKRIIVLP
ncbi:MAG: YCF48-related protein [Fibrobacteria bacterium]